MPVKNVEKTSSVGKIDEPIKESINSKIQKFFDDNQFELKKFKWSENLIIKCSFEENLLIDQKAASFLLKKEGENNQIFKIFSEKVRPIHFNKIDETPIKSTSKDSNILMLSDIIDKNKPPPIPKSDPENLTNIIDCFNKRKPFLKNNIVTEDMQILELSKQKILFLESTDIKINFKLIEPLFFDAFIVQNNKIISEQWTFTITGSENYIKNISLPSNASFQLPISYESAYFCVVVSRFLLPENGSAVNLYYQKPSPKTLTNARSQAMQYNNKIDEVFSPFAFTFIQLKTVVENKNFNLPQPFAISQQLITIIEQISTGQNFGTEIYPINFEFKSSINEIFNLQNNDIKFIYPLPIRPCYYFRHRFIVKIKKINLHSSERNIFVELNAVNENGNYPIFTSSYSNKKTSKRYTRCYYHEKKPHFDQFFNINLPFPLPKVLVLYATIYNVSLKNSNKGTDSLESIGKCTIPIIKEGNRIITDGKHSFDVEYKGQIIQSAFHISTFLDSSFMPKYLTTRILLYQKLFPNLLNYHLLFQKKLIIF